MEFEEILIQERKQQIRARFKRIVKTVIYLNEKKVTNNSNLS